ncbi:MAG: hypothetical protein ACYDCN_04430 [Bacteroidia bacterium]
MIGLNSTPYNPSEHEHWLLEMLFGGKTQVIMAGIIKKPDSTVRQQVDRLREKLGAETNEQMMAHYGQHKLRKANAAQGSVRPNHLLKDPAMQRCLSCPKGKIVQDIKKFVEDLCPR